MGGGSITAPKPADDGYCIKNNSIFPIKVTKAEAKQGEGWVLKTDANVSGTADPTDTTTKIGDISLKLTPGASSTAWDMGSAFATSKDWEIGAASSASAPGVLTLKLEGKTSKLRQAYDKNAVEAVTITYTIDAAPADTSASGGDEAGGGGAGA